MLTIEVSTITPTAEVICNLSLGSRERKILERLIGKLVTDSWNEETDFALEADEYMLLDEFSRRFEKLNNVNT